MSFDFDEIIDRRGAHGSKWDNMEQLFGVSAADGISMWTADMDFRAPPAVTAALQREIDHGIYGYFGDYADYNAAVTGWMKRRHGWDVDPESMMITPGVVNGVAISIQAYSQPGDGVILFSPVYYVFYNQVRTAGRRVVESPLAERDGRMTFDLDSLAAQLDGSERIAILCSPHNPGGQVWTREELRAVAAFCAEHDIILVSDEIHHDLTMPGETHLVASLAAPEHVDRMVICAATTKTFNLAGGNIGATFIEDPALRAQFKRIHGSMLGTPNRFGMVMATAAYGESEDWLDALRVYLDGNRRLLDAAVAEIPGLRSQPLQATYLAWVDFAGTGMTRAEYERRVYEVAKLAPSKGPTFGAGGESWLRFNFAMPRPLLQTAMERLGEAFSDLQ